MENRTDTRDAGFWLRVTPAVFDFIILSVAMAVFVSFVAIAKGTPTAFLNLRPGDPPGKVIAAFGKPAIFAILGFFVVSGWLYYAAFESSVWQGTPGKKFFGLYVADMQGNRITFGRATRRYFSGHFWLCVPSIGGLYFITDCICCGLTARKQALHDAIAGCLVLKRDQGTSR
ncbi:MAG: RDD family protein [Candidatus Acidiferrales bacterium]